MHVLVVVMKQSSMRPVVNGGGIAVGFDPLPTCANCPKQVSHPDHKLCKTCFQKGEEWRGRSNPLWEN